KPNVPTLGKFFDETMSPLWEASLAKATYSRYELSFRLHIKPVLGEVCLDELTREQAKELVVALLQKNANKRTYAEDRQVEEPEAQAFERPHPERDRNSSSHAQRGGRAEIDSSQSCHETRKAL